MRSNGTVLAWGYSSVGATNVPADLTNVVAVAGGGDHSVALRNNGTVVAWGTASLTNVPPNLTNAVMIAAAIFHSLALRSDGTVVSWGDQTTVPAGLSNVVAIAAGGRHSLALHRNGTVTTWGSYYFGDPTGTPPASVTNVVAIACGQEHSIALRNDGTLVAWGAGLPQYAGFPNYTQSTIPKGLCGVLAIAACGRQSLAIYSGIPRPFKMSEPTWQANGSFQFRCEVEPGRQYKFEASRNLVDWDQAGAITASSEIFYAVDSGAYLDSRLFYRMTTE